jgi:hypothetical protein
MDYERYYDKVYGCFLGKCIGGTAGGPAEGRKELLDAPLNEALLHSALPNDDLDIQILWLELLEKQGERITARDLAREFYERVPYGPGEYGYFQKSFACGIDPPYSGRFNNRYYKNGMGCPIRGEIWACLFPGAHALTRPYAEMDGSLDHERDSIDGEYFITTLESEAFFAKGYEDILSLIRFALEKIPSGTKIHDALSDAVELYLAGGDWKRARGMILRKYGHADCTNLYQNMAFVILALLYGKGDFRETVRLGLASGYDTDCICATAASVLGIFRGARALLEEDGMTDTGLVIGVRSERREQSIADFARDVCVAGMSFMTRMEGATEICGCPAFTPLPESRIPEYTVTAEYVGDPVLLPDRSTAIDLRITRNHGCGKAPFRIVAPDGTRFECDGEDCLDLAAKESQTVHLSVSVAPDATVLHKRNIFTVQIGEYTDRFGLMGGTVWRRFGPFLMNNCDLSKTVAPHLPYCDLVEVPEGISKYDAIRDFHLNGFADVHCEFVPEKEPFLDILPDGRAECEEELLCTGEDLFDLADVQCYEGPHTDYLTTTLISPEDRRIELAVGHTAPYKLWVNGKLVGGDERSTWWTCENRHYTVDLLRGENTVILKCAQQSHSARYSLIPKHEDGCWLQHSDIDCKIPR